MLQLHADSGKCAGQRASLSAVDAESTGRLLALLFSTVFERSPIYLTGAIACVGSHTASALGVIFIPSAEPHFPAKALNTLVGYTHVGNFVQREHAATPS